MAEFTRRTVLANPARRRATKAKSKSTSPKRRKLTPAQIAAGFGGKRRKVAATHRPTKRRNPKKGKGTYVKRYADGSETPTNRPKGLTSTPASNRLKALRAARTRARNARKNPGDIITLALANPAPAATKGKKSTMARRTKRSSVTRRRRTTTRRRRSNPVQVAHRRRTRRRSVAAAPRRRRSSARRNPSIRRRRRNPSMGGGVRSGMSGFLTQGLWAIGGAAGSKMLTQMVLGSSNTGVMGYGGNLAAAFVLGTGVKMVLKNQAAGNAVILGGVIQTLLRVLIDRTPFGAKVSNLGMGDYMAQNFLTPQRLVDGLNSAQIAPPVMPPASKAVGVGVYGGSLY